MTIENEQNVELPERDTDVPPAPPVAAETPSTDNAPETPIADDRAGDGDLSAEMAVLTEKYDTLQNQYVRIAADFDNFRKRTTKEKEDLEQKVKCETIRDLLGVIDNFERARTQIKPQNEGETTIQRSYQGVYKQLVESLKKVGVTPMRPEGQPFDPTLHEAVMRQQTDEHPEGIVLEELQRGYFIGDRVLRHSLVKVSAPIDRLSADDADEDLDLGEG
jgi:molecular chaperone GrpE